MKVSYNGFTGDLVKLVKLERTLSGKICLPVNLSGKPYHQRFYDLSIYDNEKKVTHSFTDVKLEDVKFLGGAVVFDG